MNDESDDDKCNCKDCYVQPNRAFRIIKGTIEPDNAVKSAPGLKRGFLNTSKKSTDEAVIKKVSESSQSTSAPRIKEPHIEKQRLRSFSTPETIECEKIPLPQKHQTDEKIDLKCTKCSENNENIDAVNQGSFRITCTEGCIITLHRNCFEKLLGSGKKKELKASLCPTDSCGGSLTVINHRVPGKSSDFMMWLRCEGKETEKPKKEEKTKEVKKKDTKENKYKKDRREEEENRKEGNDGISINNQSNIHPNSVVDEKPMISLALPIKSKDEDGKKNLVKPLSADLDARPIERKEDALMSKYAVKETTTKEKKRNKKEIRQVVLPGLTVKGQRGRIDDNDDNTHSTVEETQENNKNGEGIENTDIRYGEKPYGFLMPAEVEHGMIEGRGVDWIGGGMGNMMNTDIEMNNHSNPFHHPLPIGHGVFRQNNTVESAPVINSSSQFINDHNGRNSLSGFTQSPSIDEPPLIENPFDYPTLEKESVREKKELIHFFEIYTPVLEENVALFDSSHIDLEQLKNMLSNFIDFQFDGNEEEKKNMTDTLQSIFNGEVERDIIPFLMDLQCFKYGYIDGRLVVSVKTEGKERREREEQIRREKEEEERRKKEEEAKRKREKEEEIRRKEEMRKEEVRRAVSEWDENRKRKIEEQKLIDEESARMNEELQRKKNEEKRRMEEDRRAKSIEKRRKEEEDERMEEELRKRKDIEDTERKEMEEKMKKEEKEREEKLAHDTQMKHLEERRKMKEEEEERKRRMMNEKEKMRIDEVTCSKKDVEKKTKERELERKTREAINTLRKHDESKSSSSEPSPERNLLMKCGGSSGYSSSSIPLPPSSSSSISFSTAAIPFVPRIIAPKIERNKADFNPNAPAFIPSTEDATLIDENGTEVNNMWIDGDMMLVESRNTIEELNRRIAELEAEKFEIEEKNRMTEMEMSKIDGIRVDENRMNYETIAQLEARVRDIDEQIEWKDTMISDLAVESENKSAQLNLMEKEFLSKMDQMKTKIRDCNSVAITEKVEKENALQMINRREEEKRKGILERKIGCAKDAAIMCSHIINKLVDEVEARVMTSVFIDLRRKWIEHYSNLKLVLDALNNGKSVDLELILSLKEPSMPREADNLVKECYVYHYQAFHCLSFKLAGMVKRCLREHQREGAYDDASIIGIIQKWMRFHKDPTKINATVNQVANMVAQAMGDAPLFPPKYSYVTNRVPMTHSTPSTPSTPTMNTQLRTQSSLNRKDEPKGWKKASDKIRQVDHDHECSICLEDTEGGDISYCEQISCNEPYHNACLDQYWKTGGRFCPRCRTPMPPRDAYPALA